MRPNQVIHTGLVHQEVEVLPSLDGVLLPGDIEALEDAIRGFAPISPTLTLGFKCENRGI